MFQEEPSFSNKRPQTSPWCKTVSYIQKQYWSFVYRSLESFFLVYLVSTSAPEPAIILWVPSTMLNSVITSWGELMQRVRRKAFALGLIFDISSMVALGCPFFTGKVVLGYQVCSFPSELLYRSASQRLASGRVFVNCSITRAGFQKIELWSGSEKCRSTSPKKAKNNNKFYFYFVIKSVRNLWFDYMIILVNSRNNTYTNYRYSIHNTFCYAFLL